MTHPRTRLVGIERRFGSVQALAGADLELLAGEVHGVLGANGAGKSTLFNVLGGMVRPDAGRIEVDGAAVVLRTPRDAWHHGIGLVHQHFTLVPALTVLENLALGVRTRTMPIVRRDVEGIMERTGLHVPLEPKVERLGVGDRQRIEILKALLRDPHVLVLDEPTAVLTPDEVEGLFAMLRSLAGEGRAVALVAHKLDEVLGVADRVTVLRGGRTVLTARPGEHDVRVFVEAMVGDAAAEAWLGATTRPGLGAAEPTESDAGPERVPLTPGDAVAARDPVAVLDAVRMVADSGPGLNGVSLEVRPGQIVGIAGVEGNGQRELARVLAGRSMPDAGAVRIPEEVAFIPQDRRAEGLIDDFDLAENVALALHRTEAHTDGPWLRWETIRRAADDIRQRFAVAAPSVTTRAGTLSGGNQQRVIVGRELALESSLLVAENPTRGLDIASTRFVFEELRQIAADGVAIVLISTDLDEVLALSTDIWAIARGRLVHVPLDERSLTGIGARMLGGWPSDDEGLRR